jgi:glycosyltransferase involved in cell wall biosynthesis
LNAFLPILSWIGLGLAVLPFILYFLNLRIYRPLPRRLPGSGSNADRSKIAPTPVSVLLPARNEEANLGPTLDSILSNKAIEFEVIVLDDHSTDSTAAVVNRYAERDSRVRLQSAPDLPPGWCGKQHACHILAQLAKHPLLVFIDADVRLQPDALARIASSMDQDALQSRNPGSSYQRTPLALLSGIPRQEMVTGSERLLLPLIHSVLLGYLPMHAMRKSSVPALSAGCGQLFIARADAYRSTRGHEGIRTSLHDGIQLPRLFRRSGLKTDLFDATDVATCRMYPTHLATWRGLAKNATEGLAAPGTLLPMSFLLFGAHVLPFLMLGAWPSLSIVSRCLVIVAILLSWVPRIHAARRFRQPWDSAFLHPLGVLSLLGIQWVAFLGKVLGRPMSWKGRLYPHAPSSSLEQKRSTV